MGDRAPFPGADLTRIEYRTPEQQQPQNAAELRILEALRAHFISRLRHREFGVLVTTSHVAPQAYQEIRADMHPIVIMAGVDIVTLLQEKGYATPGEVARWLNEAFPALRP